jgi:hypothetical protein
MNERRGNERGRLVFPAVDALMGYALRPFPWVRLAVGRCGICRAVSVRWAVLPTGTVGEAAAHGPACAAVEAAYA